MGWNIYQLMQDFFHPLYHNMDHVDLWTMTWMSIMLTYHEYDSFIIYVSSRSFWGSSGVDSMCEARLGRYTWICMYIDLHTAYIYIYIIHIYIDICIYIYTYIYIYVTITRKILDKNRATSVLVPTCPSSVEEDGAAPVKALVSHTEGKLLQYLVEYRFVYWFSIWTLKSSRLWHFIF